MAGKQDIRNPLSGVMVNQLKYLSILAWSETFLQKPTTNLIFISLSLLYCTFRYEGTTLITATTKSSIQSLVL
jgi:hypothetical protein